MEHRPIAENEVMSTVNEVRTEGCCCVAMSMKEA